jgi:hypothetical protein
MPTLTINYSTDSERLAYERAIAFVAEMSRLGLHAPAGGVLDACEGFALSQGRQLLQATLTDAVQARVQEAEKKKRRPTRRRAVTPAETKAGVPDPS